MTFAELFEKLSVIGNARLRVEAQRYRDRLTLEWGCSFPEGHDLCDEDFCAESPEELLAMVELAAARAVNKPADLNAVIF